MEKIRMEDLKHMYSQPQEDRFGKVLLEQVEQNESKIIVLDDDPTGVQTVHDISVFTDWSYASIKKGFNAPEKLFYILTNSRGFTFDNTQEIHREIAQNIAAISKELNQDFILISRSDSTLRGHYPTETQVLKDTLSDALQIEYDGEIICPFFKEGGRYTINNIHYLEENGILTPCAETEFARDKTFGYVSSHLGEWIEEKTKGAYTRNQTLYISLDTLRKGDLEGITNTLMSVRDFGKVVVNALDYCDLTVFCTALYRVLEEGKRFLYRTAASFVKVVSANSDQPLLSRGRLPVPEQGYGGLIIAGSHTKKTTEQLETLLELDTVEYLEFNQHLVLNDASFRKEIERVSHACEALLMQNKVVVVATRRERIDLNCGSKEEELKLAVKVSEGLTAIVSGLKVCPGFVLAKGGITSSDIGVKALKVRQARVAGQIKPGIPVWITGEDSKFKGIPYIIFPGNVGGRTTLREIAEILMGSEG